LPAETFHGCGTAGAPPYVTEAAPLSTASPADVRTATIDALEIADVGQAVLAI